MNGVRPHHLVVPSRGSTAIILLLGGGATALHAAACSRECRGLGERPPVSCFVLGGPKGGVVPEIRVTLGIRSVPSFGAFTGESVVISLSFSPAAWAERSHRSPIRWRLWSV